MVIAGYVNRGGKVFITAAINGGPVRPGGTKIFGGEYDPSRSADGCGGGLIGAAKLFDGKVMTGFKMGQVMKLEAFGGEVKIGNEMGFLVLAANVDEGQIPGVMGEMADTVAHRDGAFGPMIGVIEGKRHGWNTVAAMAEKVDALAVDVEMAFKIINQEEVILPRGIASQSARVIVEADLIGAEGVFGGKMLNGIDNYEQGIFYLGLVVFGDSQSELSQRGAGKAAKLELVKTDDEFRFAARAEAGDIDEGFLQSMVKRGGRGRAIGSHTNCVFNMGGHN